MRAARALAATRVSRDPVGEAPITVGAVLEAWDSVRCDGAAVIGPWGCGPGLVAESILRAEATRGAREAPGGPGAPGLPMLFIQADGTPIDDGRTDGFCWGLGTASGHGAGTADGGRPRTA